MLCNSHRRPFFRLSAFMWIHWKEVRQQVATRIWHLRLTVSHMIPGWDDFQQAELGLEWAMHVSYRPGDVVALWKVGPDEMGDGERA